MRIIPLFMAAAVVSSVLVACSGEDRSGEQPFPPTVVTRSVEAMDGACVMYGEVTASPNSSLLECGFVFGNDTLTVEYKAAEPVPQFSVTADSVASGDYYVVAYAVNGMGKSKGDTLRVRVP